MSTAAPTHTPLPKALPAANRALNALEAAIAETGLPLVTRELVKIRASQINGCGFCLDMHHKDALAAGETIERLYMLSAWREATVYTPAERAALALTEAITNISLDHVPAEVEAEARTHYDDETFAALVYAIVAINAWNRLAITNHTEPGHYQAGDHKG